MRRAGREFPPATKEYAYRRSGGSCEQCGSKEQIEMDHILPLWYAAEYFPQLAKFALKSAENIRCLCHNCHLKKHQDNDVIVFTAQAMYLLSLYPVLLD